MIRYTLVKRLTTSLSQDRGALWSPDGERIYFWSGGAAGTGLQWKDVQGDGASNLLNEFGSPQTRSPDGRTIVYVTVTPQTGYDIWTVSIDDGTTATLFDTSFSETAPAISPDGQWIAHASTESGQWEVYVSSFPDVEAGRWQVSSSGGSFPSWSPNGEELYYIRGKSMMGAKIASGRPFRWSPPEVLFEGDYLWSSNFSRPYDVAPDGRFLMIKPIDPANKIVVVENWSEELKTLVPIEGK